MDVQIQLSRPRGGSTNTQFRSSTINVLLLQRVLTRSARLFKPAGFFDELQITRVQHRRDRTLGNSISERELARRERALRLKLIKIDFAMSDWIENFHRRKF